jgi:hypothetical protein
LGLLALRGILCSTGGDNEEKYQDDGEEAFHRANSVF